MRLVFDVVDVPALVQFVRELVFPQFSLSRFLPARTVEDIEYRIVRNKRSQVRVAKFRAFDAESPIGARPSVEDQRGALPPISEKMPLTEGERLQLERLYRELNQRLVDQVFDDATLLAQRVQARLELARGEALSTGLITINENGLLLDAIDYGIPAAHQVTPAVLFSDQVNADPLENLLDWQETYVSTNGFQPGVILTSTPVRANMLRNQKIRELVHGPASNAGVVSNADLGAVLEAHGLPPIEVYDRKVIDATGTEVRVIAEDRLLFLPGENGQVGETQMGVTAEALELASQQDVDFSVEDAPGIIAVTYKSEDPVTRWTKAAAIGLPVIEDPDAILTADVQ